MALRIASSSGVELRDAVSRETPPVHLARSWRRLHRSPPRRRSWYLTTLQIGFSTADYGLPFCRLHSWSTRPAGSRARAQPPKSTAGPYAGALLLAYRPTPEQPASPNDKQKMVRYFIVSSFSFRLIVATHHPPFCDACVYTVAYVVANFFDAKECRLMVL